MYRFLSNERRTLLTSGYLRNIFSPTVFQSKSNKEKLSQRRTLNQRTIFFTPNDGLFLNSGHLKDFRGKHRNFFILVFVESSRLIQYSCLDYSRSILKILIKHVDGKLKSKPGSSESYVDVQISAYRFRTYRNPGYRRPARSVIRKQIEFQLDAIEIKTTFLLIFLLRYDPFSRLKVDGEVAVKLSELNNRGFLQGCQVELSKEITKSNQDFTAFIFRPKQNVLFNNILFQVIYSQLLLIFCT